MRFCALNSLACLAAVTTAATIPADARSTMDIADAPVEKRQLITALVTALLTAAATEVGTLVVEDAANAAVAAYQYCRHGFHDCNHYLHFQFYQPNMLMNT
jgi:hypothetical protein